MSAIRSLIHDRPMLRGALIVPSVIVLIFGLFNLSAAPDPTRIAPHVRIGLVNADAGLTFPPVNMGERLSAGLAQRLPAPLRPYLSEEAARAALAADEIAAAILLPADFSAQVMGQGPVGARVLVSGSATAVEAQVAASLPAMLEGGIGTAVSSIRLAIAQGRMPDLASPVAIAAETLNPPPTAATRAAPGVAVFVAALAAMVGALIGNLATRGLPGRVAASARALAPVVALPVAMAVLAGLILAFGGGGGLALWLALTGVALAWGWASAGVLALAGPAGVLVLLPLVFYQPLLGGATIPVAALPGWLAWLAPVGFEGVGAHLRSLILGGANPFPWALALGGAGLGLALIGVSSLRGRG